VLEIIKPLSAIQVYDEMGARTSNPIAFYEAVFPVVVRYKRLTMIFLLGGA
jgi:hypothetical protein